MDSRLDRRTLLRGLGTVMALPLLDAMAPRGAKASGGDSAAPLRMAFLFVPNGINMDHWRPQGTGSELVLPSTLQPLAGLKNSINVLSGLSQHNAFALGDGGGDHARSAAAWLTGCHPVKTDGANIKAGVSADQLAAQKRGHLTLFPSIELGIEPGSLAGNCDSGYSCAYSHAISWRSENTPVAKDHSPRSVFERLFQSAISSDNAQSRTLRSDYKQSILDLVAEDASSLKKKLGTHDRQKLDEYFTGIREIELRIARAEEQRKNLQRFEPQIRELDRRLIALQGSTPKDANEHIRLMGDMMVLAFQTDLTRISTFMFADEGSGRRYHELSIGDGHHDLSHHGKDKDKLEKLRQINHFHVEQLAYILGRMQSIQEGDKTLLDNSMVLYGAGICDGDRHNHNDLPLVLAGHAGGTLKGGRHLKFNDPEVKGKYYHEGTPIQERTPMTNLLITMLDRFGIPGETLGDSTGKVDQLF